MKKKLRLAIVCTVLQCVISFFTSRYPFFYQGADWFITATGDILFLIRLLCSLGTLPFFIALYKSNDFINIIDKDVATSQDNPKDESWFKHLLIRVAILLVAYLFLYTISLLDNSLGAGYIVAYGILMILGASTVILSIEAVILFRNKLFFKSYGNMFILGVSLWILLGLL